MAVTKSRAVKSVQEKGTVVLAWLSLLTAFAGGAFATAMFIGSIIRELVRWLPDSWGWMPGMLLVVMVFGTGIDIFLDLTPNYFAVYSAIFAASVASAVPGKLGDKVTELAVLMRGNVDSGLQEWVGTASTVGLAVTGIAVSLLMARRVVKRSGAASASAARPAALVR